MKADSGGVALIENVATDMMPPLDYQHRITVFVQRSGDGRSRQTGAYDEEVWLFQNATLQTIRRSFTRLTPASRAVARALRRNTTGR